MKFIGTITKRDYSPNEFPASAFPWCGVDGELLDLAPFPVRFPLDKIRNRPPNLWRYLEALPFDEKDNTWRAISMGEGFTPLVSLGDQSDRVMVKVDYQMPTWSFKDRGAVVLMAKAKSLGAKHVVQDSSGNAGTSVAAYAARAGIQATIFVPAATSPKKISQIRAYGAQVIAVPGTREDTAYAAKKAASDPSVLYASHVYNPLFYQGTKTYAYEIWEQLGRVPEVLVLPVGNGTLVLGCFYGFQDLFHEGLIKEMPRFIAVQSARCAPLFLASQSQNQGLITVVNQGTIAEGIAISAPARHRQILEAIEATNGSIVTVEEEEIEPAIGYLASRGFFVEPTSAVTYAAYVRHRDLFFTGETVVIPLCGAGLKSLK